MSWSTCSSALVKGFLTGGLCRNDSDWRARRDGSDVDHGEALTAALTLATAWRFLLAPAQPDWARFAERMASGLFGRDVEEQTLRKAGRYRRR